MGLTLEQRRIERAGAIASVIAPRDWTCARIEAWLDWGETLAADYPGIDLPEALRPGSPLDPALGVEQLQGQARAGNDDGDYRGRDQEDGGGYRGPHGLSAYSGRQAS